MGHLNGIRWPRNTAKKLMDPSSKAKELTQFENTTRCPWVISQESMRSKMPIVESNKYPTWSNVESNYVNFPGRQGENLYKIPKITNNGI